MRHRDQDWLEMGARELGIELTAAQIEQFDRYARLLNEWNRRMNLTRIPPEEVVPLHFLDSLFAASVLNQSAGTLIDVGTGAGFPGLPLKIALPGLKVTLLDSTRKRLAFLDAVIHELGLADVRTVHARAEVAARDPGLREQFDFATARAVARLPALAEWLLPFVRVGGTAIALKSASVEGELEEAGAILRALGAAQPRLKWAVIPGTDVRRSLVLMQKRRPTPGRFPRGPGELRKAQPRKL